MALNFPSSPTIGQVYSDSTSGFSYEWDGTVWKSYSPSSSNQIQSLDDISASFDGVQTTFALTSGGGAVYPASPQSLIINLGGVVQDPSDDYTVSGSNIIFSTPPTNGLSFSGISLGRAVPINTIPNGTITDGSLVVSGPLTVSGIVTAPSFKGSSQIGVAVEGAYSGLTTQFNFEGTNVTITPTYDVVSGITTLSFVSSGGGGGVTETETTVSTTNPTGVGSFATATYRSANVVLQITQGTNYQVGKYSMIHDGSSVTIIEESSIATNAMLGSFDGVINGSNAEIRVTLASAGIATVTAKIDTVTIP